MIARPNRRALRAWRIPSSPRRPAAPPALASAPPRIARDRCGRTCRRTDTLAGKTVWVVDANSLIFQVFHAIPEMTSPRGEPVAAVYGFTRDLLFLLDEKKPDYLFVAFDRPEPTFRHRAVPRVQGAAERNAARSAGRSFPPSSGCSSAMGMAALELASYEADDILATIAHRTDELGGECFLVTADKDCRQLISPRVKIFNVRKNQVYDAAALMADWGVRPEQVVDFQALVGDAVDNIPGVPLVGPKVAREWLEKFGSLDELLLHAGELPAGKRKQNLLDADSACWTVGGWWPWSGTCRWRSIGRPAASAAEAMPDNWPSCAPSLVFAGWPRNWPAGGAGGAIESRGSAQIPAAETSAPSAPTSATAALAEPAPAAEPAEADWTVDYQSIDTPEKLADFVARLRKEPVIAFDTETTHVWPNWAELVGCSFCWRSGEAYYLPLRTPAGEPHLDPQAGAGRLARSAGKPGREKGRAKPEVRHDRAAIRRHQAGRRRVRHDDRQLSARCRRAQSQPGRAFQALSATIRRSRSAS